MEPITACRSTMLVALLGVQCARTVAIAQCAPTSQLLDEAYLRLHGCSADGLADQTSPSILPSIVLPETMLWTLSDFPTQELLGCKDMCMDGSELTRELGWQVKKFCGRCTLPLPYPSPPPPCLAWLDAAR